MGRTTVTSRARLVGPWTLLAVIAGACCSWWRPVAGEPVDADCPRESREVAVGGIRYCLLTCPGVLQNRVYCPPGLDGVRDFDGARVCAIQHHEHGIIQSRVYPDPLPDEVCRRLPHGCLCSPDNPLCQRWDPAERALAEMSPVRSRCAPTDQDCGPISFHNICLDRAGYDPKARRIPHRIPRDLRIPARLNPCRHDGECLSGGCGYACLSLNLAGEVNFTCLGRPDIEKALEDHFCGCVNGTCTWFAQ